VDIVKSIKKERMVTGFGKRKLSRIFHVNEEIIGGILRNLTYREVSI
jgi:hypothetical protein